MLGIGSCVASHQILHLLLHSHLHASSQQWVRLSHDWPLLLSELHSGKQSVGPFVQQ